MLLVHLNDSQETLATRANATSSNKEPFFPLLMYGINGKDAHDMDSPSFYNPVEVTRCVAFPHLIMLAKILTF